VTVAAIALIRTACVILGFVRTLLRRRRTISSHWGIIEWLCLPEPLVLAAVTFLLVEAGLPRETSAVAAVVAMCGALLAAIGLALMLWAFVSLPTVGTGHYVLSDQPITDQGAYGVVRHPLYLAAFLIWLGLALAYGSLGTLLMLLLYVVPVYVLYIREEERMLTEHYGDAYRDYSRRVGTVLPRFGA
jgi:protein-S-isoprenylcysteine O-methyltransferase Ste14